MTSIIYKPRKNSHRIKCFIPYKNEVARNEVKMIPNSYYHYNQKLWSVINTVENKKKLHLILTPNYVVKEFDSPVKPEPVALTNNEIEKLNALEQKLILKAYSPNTIRTYKSHFSQFLSYFSAQEIDQLGKTEIENYLFHLVNKYKISPTKQNQMVNAIKAYYEHVLGKQREYYDIQRPKKEQRLPGVLSKAEVKKLINSPNNVKHKAILYTIYSAGLRSGEALNLRIQDIRSDDGYIYIKGGKGKKDRQTILSPILLDLLRNYYRNYKPSFWLFEGQFGDKYTKSSIAKLFRKAANESGINPWATLHTLRHSFATHLVQDGVNLRIIQSLLGHNSSKTTEIYTHISDGMRKEIISPLDGL